MDLSLFNYNFSIPNAEPQWLIAPLLLMSFLLLFVVVRKRKLAKSNALEQDSDSIDDIDLNYQVSDELSQGTKTLDGLVKNHVEEFPDYFVDEKPDEINFPKTLKESRSTNVPKSDTYEVVEDTQLSTLLNEAIQEDIVNDRNKTYAKLMFIQKNPQFPEEDKNNFKIILQSYREGKSLLDLLSQYPLSIDKSNENSSNFSTPQEKVEADWLSSFGNSKANGKEIAAKKQWDVKPDEPTEINDIMASIAQQAEQEENLVDDEHSMAQQAIKEMLESQNTPMEHKSNEKVDKKPSFDWGEFGSVVQAINADPQIENESIELTNQLKVDLSMENTAIKYEYWVNWMCLVNGKASLRHNFVTFSSPWGKRAAINELFDFLSKQAGTGTTGQSNMWSILSVHRVED